MLEIIRSSHQPLNISGEYVEGYAAIWNRPERFYDPREKRWITEVIRSNAFLIEGEVLAKIDHQGAELARLSDGSLEITQDDYGLKFKMPLNESMKQEILRGKLRGASFRATPRKMYFRHGLQEIILAKLTDLGPATQPLHPTTNLVLVREK